MTDFLRAILFLPPEASTYASSVDWLHYFVIITTFAGTGAVSVVALTFIIRYRRSRTQPKDEAPRPDTAPQTPPHLEMALITLLVVLFFFWWILGARLYTQMRVPPPGAMRVYVTAKQWMWKFEYVGGQRSIDELYVPTGRPIELLMTSRDVIHSFYVPAFRNKMDVIPGRFTTYWFQANQPGTYQILCAEYCGTGHSVMRGEVVALAPRDFDRWLTNDSRTEALTSAERLRPIGVQPSQQPESHPQALGREVGLAAQGREVAARYECLKCHTLDGSPAVGPTWLGLYRSTVHLQGGGEVTADEAYLTESMMDPDVKVVAGYPAKMPSYQGQLTAPEVARIIELIRSLQYGTRAPGAPGGGGPEERGAEPRTGGRPGGEKGP